MVSSQYSGVNSLGSFPEGGAGDSGNSRADGYSSTSEVDSVE